MKEAVLAGTLVYGDWNCGASRLDVTSVCRAVADLDIMLQQPCATLEERAAVLDPTGLAMEIDENGRDTASLIRSWQLGCMDAVALNLSKFDDLSQMRRARDLCLDLGVKMCIEDIWCSDITTGNVLCLAAATPLSGIMNICDLSGYIGPRRDPSAPACDGGYTIPSKAHGIGVNPDLDLLGAPVLELSA